MKRRTLARAFGVAQREQPSRVKVLANSSGVCQAIRECGRAVLWSARHHAVVTRAWAIEMKSVSLSSSSRSRPLKLSMKPFCIGLPGAM